VNEKGILTVGPAGTGSTVRDATLNVEVRAPLPLD
jgi:hypothetical protein